MISLLIILQCIIGNHAMVEHLHHLKIGYEVRSVHQFKFGKGGSLEMKGFIVDPNEVEEGSNERNLLEFASPEGEVVDDDDDNDDAIDVITENGSDDGLVDGDVVKEETVGNMDADDSDQNEGGEQDGEETVEDDADEEDNEEEEEGEEEEAFALHIYHCTDKEIENLNKFNSMHKLCENIDDFECSYNLMVDDSNKMDEIDYTFNSLQTQWMTMIIISCSEKEMYDISSLSLMAKSKSARLDGYNEYLSLNQINYKYIFLWLAIGYLFLFFVYFLHLFRYRYFNISMQSLLIFYPFFQFILCVFSNLYWNFSSIHGVESEEYLVLCYVFDALCNGLLSLILLFICFGWKFMNNSIQPKSYKIKIEIFLICTFIVVASILQNYYSSMLLLTVISYVLCCRRMLKSYTNNVKLLQLQIEILMNHSALAESNNDAGYQGINSSPKKSPAEIKLHIFKVFQKGIIVFIAAKIIFYWISSLLLYEYPWINDIILNALTIGFTVFLFYNFRMSRSFKPYFYLIDSNVEEWDSAKHQQKAFTKNINYNLSFQCDTLIIANNIDYFKENGDDEYDSDEEEEERIVKNYSLSTPFTIDLNQNKHRDENNENTPLLIK